MKRVKIMKKIVGFGDFLVRLSPPGYLRFSQANSFELNYTGAEANVCVALSHMGMKTDFVTKLPKNDIAYAGVAEMRKHGVGVDNIAYGGERIGVFYAEKGASQRPSRIVYDRKHSSIAESCLTDFDWDEIFKNAYWFHLTGITPALSQTIGRVCVEICKIAKERKLIVSLDLNYRKNLWSTEEAQKTITKILPYVDVLIANEEDAEKVLGIKATSSDVEKGVLSNEGYIEVAQKIEAEYNIHTISISMRRSISASDNDWGAMLYINNSPYFSSRYNIHLIDRIGGGDSFAAGIIYALANDFDPIHTIEYAAATSCLKQTIEKDFSISTVEEIEKLVNGNSSGRVER